MATVKHTCEPAPQLSEEVDVLDLKVGDECYGLYNGEQYPACVEGVGKYNKNLIMPILNFVVPIGLELIAFSWVTFVGAYTIMFIHAHTIAGATCMTYICAYAQPVVGVISLS